MYNYLKRIRIFLSSPSDVVKVRKTALKMISELDKEEAHLHGQTLYGYDQDSIPPDTCNHENKEVPEDVVLKHWAFSTCDLLIIIFWRSIGSPTGKAVSGTVQEFEEAYKRWKDTRKPQIRFYFQDIDPYCLKNPCSQIESLLKIKAELEKERVFVASFKNISEFKKRFRNDLRDLLIKEEQEQKYSREIPRWYNYSRTPENVTHSGYTYSIERTLITEYEMNILKMEYEQLRKEEKIFCPSTKYSDIYRIYRRYGDFETARIYLEKAQIERDKAYVQVYNETGSPTVISKSQAEVHKNGILHAICHIFVLLNNTHIYLQKRSPKKSISPNMWTSSSCGHIRKGETPQQAAKREILEELSLSIALSFIEEVGSVRVSSGSPQDSIKCEAFAYVFCIEIKEKLDENLINKQEIIELKLMEPQNVKKVLDVKNESLGFALNFPQIFNLFWEWYQKKFKTTSRK